MTEQEFLEILQTGLSKNTAIITDKEDLKIILPFVDYSGDHIEILAHLYKNKVALNDLGHVAGILFSLGQHAESTPGHQLVKGLAETYHITMDYNRGILHQEIILPDNIDEVFNFFKVLITLQTVLPELRQHRKRGHTGVRLAARLGRDIQSLKKPKFVQRQAEVNGKHLSWIINYKYPLKKGAEWIDVLVVAADLGFKDPITKAEHIITLASDLVEVNGRKDLRVVFDVPDNEINSDARKAASLIEDTQSRLHYKSFNYGNVRQKGELFSLTLQELLPLTDLRN